tara:strand:+ start:32374 stop:32622 length:249 start_codon:yes stop_codon:yes gene_type:complete
MGRGRPVSYWLAIAFFLMNLLNFSDELIKTAAFAVVEIEFADGFTMDLGSNSLTSLSEIAPSHQIKPTSKIQLTVSKHYSKP